MPHRVQQFNLSRLREGYSVVAAFARRRSGKTHWMEWVVGRLRDKWSFVYVISPTAKLTGAFSTVRGAIIVDRLDDGELTRIMDMMAANKQLSGLIIIDDMLGDKGLLFSPVVTRLASCSRHFRLDLWFTVQNPSMISTTLKSQTDIALIWSTVHTLTRKHLSANFNFCSTEREFFDVLDSVASGYRCLVVDVAKGTRNNAYFWSLAPGTF